MVVAGWMVLPRIRGGKWSGYICSGLCCCQILTPNVYDQRIRIGKVAGTLQINQVVSAARATR